LDTTTVSKVGLDESVISDFPNQEKVQTYAEVGIVAQTIILFHKVEIQNLRQKKKLLKFLKTPAYIAIQYSWPPIDQTTGR